MYIYLYCLLVFPSIKINLDFPGGTVGKESACQCRDAGFILVSGRSPRVGSDDPLQYSCLENSMDYHSPRHSRIRHD